MLNVNDPGLLRSLDRLSAAAASSAAPGRSSIAAHAEWVQLRADLIRECQGWLEVLGTPRDVDAVALNGTVGTIAHLAYHLGAIRQINPTVRGPSAVTGE